MDKEWTEQLGESRGDLEFLANGPYAFPVLVSGPAVCTGRGKRDRGKETVVDNPPSQDGEVLS